MEEELEEVGWEVESEIRIAVRSLNSSQKQVAITNYFSKQMSVV
jgi:hypothetical protein